MTGGPVLIVFSLACAIGAIAVLCGAWLEIVKMRRGETTVTPRHYRWRLASAAVWVAALGSMGYATGFSWPKDDHDKIAARHFVRSMEGGMCLLLVGLVLLAFDLWMTAREREIYTRKLQIDLDLMAKQEIERLRAGRGEGERPA